MHASFDLRCYFCDSIDFLVDLRLVLTDMLLIFQEAIDYRRQGASCSQPGELRGRKIMKRIVDIRELNEQAKVIDDLKYV